MTGRSLLVLVALTGAAEAGRHGDRGPHTAIGFMTTTFFAERIVMPDFDDRGVLYDNGEHLFAYHARLVQHRFTAYGLRTGISYRDPHTMLAFEVGAAGGSGPEAVTDADNRSIVGHDFATVIDVDVAVGQHRRFDSIDLGAELAPGLRGISMTAPAFPGLTACAPGQRRCTAGPLESGYGTFVELRGHVDLWLTDHVTLGAIAGVDLETRAPVFGLMFRYHIGAYDLP